MFCLQGVDNGLECATTGADWVDWREPLYLYLIVAIFLVPSLIMAYSYIKLCLALWKSVKVVKKMKGGADSE